MSSLCNTLMSRFLVVSMFIALALLVYLVTSSLVDSLASLLPNFTSLTYQQVRRWDEPGAFVLSLIVTALLMRWNNYATLARYRRASTLTPLLLFLLSHLVIDAECLIKSGFVLWLPTRNACDRSLITRPLNVVGPRSSGSFPI